MPARLPPASQPVSVPHMSKQVVPVKVRAILPYNNGRAVFVGNEQKVFDIYVDENVGSAIAMFMNHTPKERPLTHDLLGHLLAALGAKVERVIINDIKTETYFARLIISAENELHARKINFPSIAMWPVRLCLTTRPKFRWRETLVRSVLSRYLSGPDNYVATD